MGSKLPSIEFDEFRIALDDFLRTSALETFDVQRAVEDSSLEDSSLEDSSLEDSSLEDSSLEDSSLEDSSLEDSSMEKLWTHYSEMVRWNPRLSLIGPGTAESVIARHYGESLMALPWIDASDRTLVDVGSGGGFPGLVLAAARTHLRATLIEPRQKKWAFLKAVSRKCGLSCEAVNARVERPFPANLKLPSSIDLVTSRALSLSADFLEAFLEHSPKTRFLLWCGKELFPLPKSAEIRRQGWLPGSESRRLIEIIASH